MELDSASGVPRQTLLPADAIAIDVNGAAPPTDAQISAASKEMASRLGSSSNSSKAPLSRFWVTKDLGVVGVAHHLVVDGVGIDNLRAAIAAATYEPPTSGFDFLDFAEWERQTVAALPTDHSSRQHWAGVLQNRPAMQWRWTPLRTASAPRRVAVAVNSGVEKLRAAAESPTAFPVMAALWMRAVAEFLEPNDESSGNDPGATDVLVLSTHANRHVVAGTDKMVGCFVATPVFRASVKHGAAVDVAWIRAAVGGIWTAQEHAWVPASAAANAATTGPASASTGGAVASPVMIEMYDDATLLAASDNREEDQDVSFELKIHMLPNGTATVSGSGAHWGSEARLQALVQAYGAAIDAAANPGGAP